MPATPGHGQGVALGQAARGQQLQGLGARTTRQPAVASRSVSGLAETSTIRAAPLSSRWLRRRVVAHGPPRPGPRGAAPPARRAGGGAARGARPGPPPARRRRRRTRAPRALVAGEGGDQALVADLEADPQERHLAGRAAHRLAQAGHHPGPVGRSSGWPARRRRPGRTRVSKTTKQETGLPGSPYSGVPAATPNACGMPGCIATLKLRTSAEGGQDLLGVVAVPHRHPARGQHQVALGRGQGEPAPQRLRVVAELVAAQGVGPGRADLGDQQPGVGVADLARPQRLARVDQLVAGGHDLTRGGGGPARSCGRPRPASRWPPGPGPGAQHHRALADVLTGLAHEPARAGVEADQHGVTVDRGLLDRHHRVRPGGRAPPVMMRAAAPGSTVGSRPVPANTSPVTSRAPGGPRRRRSGRPRGRRSRPWPSWRTAAGPRPRPRRWPARSRGRRPGPPPGPAAGESRSSTPARASANGTRSGGFGRSGGKAAVMG